MRRIGNVRTMFTVRVTRIKPPHRSLSRVFNVYHPPQSYPHRRFTDSVGSKMVIPIILCGKTEAIGAGVVQGLKPEYEGSSSLSPFGNPSR